MAQSSKRSKRVSLCVLLFAYFASTIIAEDGMFFSSSSSLPTNVLGSCFPVSLQLVSMSCLLFCGYALWVLDHLVIPEI
uniref:Transmembrane protein n=1 Tax=Quercus lobata TaxID=97700 RepID=A0A7N2LRI0_QUELO